MTRKVRVGEFELGGGNPIRVQTMWKERLPPDPEPVLERLFRLKAMGCDIIRFACPGLEEAERLGALSVAAEGAGLGMPLVVDIHFDWRIALRCMDFPIHKVRINPGNIGERRKVVEVLSKAKDKGLPIRIGVNSGSLPKDLAGREDLAEAIVEAAERELAIFDECDFRDVLVSLKASDIETTVRANEAFSARRQEPIHLGLTEAGPLIPGTVKTTLAFQRLLTKGIGDTIRVSLSDDMENEVIAGREILSALGLAQDTVNIVSCPRCGRNTFDTHAFTERWRDRLYAVRKKLTIAVMGCVVNGPGEASHADLGITGAGGKVTIFSRGKLLKTVEEEAADAEFESALKDLISGGA